MGVGQEIVVEGLPCFTPEEVAIIKDLNLPADLLNKLFDERLALFREMSQSEPIVKETPREELGYRGASIKDLRADTAKTFAQPIKEMLLAKKDLKWSKTKGWVPIIGEGEE